MQRASREGRAGEGIGDWRMLLREGGERLVLLRMMMMVVRRARAVGRRGGKRVACGRHECRNGHAGKAFRPSSLRPNEQAAGWKRYLTFGTCETSNPCQREFRCGARQGASECGTRATALPGIHAGPGWQCRVNRRRSVPVTDIGPCPTAAFCWFIFDPSHWSTIRRQARSRKPIRSSSPVRA